MSVYGWQLVTETDADNPVLGDLRISKRKLATLPTFGDRVAQSIRTRLRWWRGEWFLDTARGVPYLEQLLGKGVSLDTIRSVLRREIEQVAGVTRVTSIEITSDRATRYSTIDIEALTTEAELVVVGGVEIGAAG